MNVYNIDEYAQNTKLWNTFLNKLDNLNRTKDAGEHYWEIFGQVVAQKLKLIK